MFPALAPKTYSILLADDQMLVLEALAKWWGENVTISKQISESQRFTGGAEFRDNFQQDQGNYDLQPVVQYFKDSRTSTVSSAYAQNEMHLRKKLILNPGLRYDH